MIKYVTLYLTVLMSVAFTQEIPEKITTPVPTSSPIEQELVHEENIDDSIIMVPGDPNLFDDRFEMPPEEALGDCIYAAGMSFPSVCFVNGKEFFNVEIHSQEVLDQIVTSQGKQGKYNKIPPGYLDDLKEREDGFELIDPGAPYTLKQSGR